MNKESVWINYFKNNAFKTYGLKTFVIKSHLTIW